MGILLLIFAAGLLGDAVQNMQQLGWLAFGTAPLWNTASVIPESSTIGDIMHTFLGYAEAPTILQSVLYAIYVLVAGSIFTWMTRKPPLARPAPASTNTKSAVTSGALHSKV